MTAIFVFCEKETVFIACDTRRGSVLPRIARKIQVWDDFTIFAQTGHGEGLTRLFGAMLSWQHKHDQFSGYDGPKNAFDRVGQTRLSCEKSQLKSPGLAKGTLVSARVESLHGSACIRTYDWVSGSVSTITNEVYADGTEPAAFQKIAETEYRALRPNGNGAFDLAEWGERCIDLAVAACEIEVAWPADFAIVRQLDGHRLCIIERLDKGQQASKLFSVD
ncbi:hypothetical protein [Beijerinckia sp. L45]|uniref:hypothetical protein n=1 Tax=Beijerinckia sp. L45 TaxID=1641855 RepID=UPI00131D1CBE|nr:hypothetical protein [Beijerinckia sp. L45]